MKFGSLFAGIGGFDLGLERAGMTPAWQVEIDAAARSVLARHWPNVPRFDDVRTVGRHNLVPVDVICGGFPCQDLSVAGKREGITGARSGLFFEMVRITNELRPAFLVWENVPGLLSSANGRDFAAVLMALDAIGYHGSWTGFDARYFGLAQRRRRIFGVFARHDIGAGRCAEILSLANRLRGYSETGEQKGEDVAGTLTGGTAGNRSHGKPNGSDRRTIVAYGGNNTSGPIDISTAVNAKGGTGRMDFESETFVLGDGRLGRSTLRQGRTTELYSTSHGIRRLTPIECERLQGFPDGWTAGQADGPRYRQLGNAVAVPVVEWIGRMILEADAHE